MIPVWSLDSAGWGWVPAGTIRPPGTIEPGRRKVFKGMYMRHLPLLVLALGSPVLADDWPNWLGLKRDNVWRETGILDKFPPGGPKVLWRAKVAGGYSGPAVAGGKVYVGD